eukprot:GHVR01095456.1.p1 GENE.GHVR01095456.1~~GHVR01095456.1.p1  ORF type:complete len:117 (+),score=13.54 GHVR01095456.1:268-618(+)
MWVASICINPGVVGCMGISWVILRFIYGVIYRFAPNKFNYLPFLLCCTIPAYCILFLYLIFIIRAILIYVFNFNQFFSVFIGFFIILLFLFCTVIQAILLNNKMSQKHWHVNVKKE